MKKLTFLLSFLLTFTGMFAQVVTKYPTSTSQSFGLAVVAPTYAVTKAPLVVFLHGIGGKGNGTSTELDNLIKNEIPQQVKDAVQKYGFIVVAVQSGSAFTLNEPKFARDWALKNLSVDATRKYLTGLSWGGGGVAGFIISSLENAQAFDAAAPIAMTLQNTTAAGCGFVATANLPLWIFHNIDDDNAGTKQVYSQWFYDCIAATTIKVKPAYTFFKKSGHGGWGEAYSNTTIPMPAGSLGLTAPTQNLWEWFLSNTSTTRVSPGTAATSPTTSTSGITAVIKYTLKDNQLSLDGTGSANYKSATWQVTGRPNTVNEYKSFINGSGWITASGTLPDTGSYIFKLTTFANGDYTGTSANTSVTVTYKVDTVIVSQPPVVLPPTTKTIIARVYVGGYEFVLYSDGTSESSK